MGGCGPLESRPFYYGRQSDASTGFPSLISILLPPPSPHFLSSPLARTRLPSQTHTEEADIKLAAGSMATVQCLSPAPSLIRNNAGGLRLPRLTSNTALKSSSCLSPSLHQLLLRVAAPKSATIPVTTGPRFSMRVASKQAYICRDCGYIYNDRTPFEKLSDKYFCPVCGAPKRRFRAYQPAVTKDANDTSVRKARKAEIQRDEAIGRALPIAVVVGVAALAGLYFYLNSAY